MTHAAATELWMTGLHKAVFARHGFSTCKRATWQWQNPGNLGPTTLHLHMSKNLKRPTKLYHIMTSLADTTNGTTPFGNWVSCGNSIKLSSVKNLDAK